MFHLDTPSFRLVFLDPNGDDEYQGTRYVRGGYLWQAYDREHRPLFAGPLFPDPVPDIFDGQGAPEVFRAYDLRSHLPVNPIGDKVLVPGVGLLSPTDDERIRVLHDSPHWQTTLEPLSCLMSCAHTVGDHAYRMERRWSVEEKDCLRSQTHIVNTGSVPLRLQWFAHPFFPPMQDGLDLDPGPDVHLPGNSTAYQQDDQGRITYRSIDFDSRHRFQRLTLPGTPTCTISLAHPICRRVRITGDFPLSFLPIWSNRNSFSPEPYLDCGLAPGETKSWSMRYHMHTS